MVHGEGTSWRGRYHDEYSAVGMDDPSKKREWERSMVRERVGEVDIMMDIRLLE